MAPETENAAVAPKIRYRLKRHKQEPWILDGPVPEPKPQSPNEWFSLKFPIHTEDYGPPILEGMYYEMDRSLRINAVALNEDFFAAVLGGDKRLNHHVVFYLPECQFYFFDPREGMYVPTTEEKLVAVLSQYLIHCAADMPHGVDIKDLFCELRRDENLRRIVRRARSMLAARENFFLGSTGHKRLFGDEIIDPTMEPPHKLFIRDGVVVEPERVLTVNDAYSNFSQYCRMNGFKPVERRYFKGLIAEVVREEFGLGLRHDLRINGGKATQGWRGITCKRLALDGTEARN